VSLVVPLRMTDKELEEGDDIVHGEIAMDLHPGHAFEVGGHRVPAGAASPTGAGSVS
jgi:hypothetical protein